MFRSRRSFKVAPGIRLNTGKRGITSVSVAGVRMGSGSAGGRSRVTKAAQTASFWSIKPGLWYVRFLDMDDGLNLEVRGSELTFERFERMAMAVDEKNAATEARIFKLFIASWDFMKDDGSGPAPISAGTLQKVGNGFYYGLAIEIVNALGVPKAPLTSRIRNGATGEPYKVIVSNNPIPDTIDSESILEEPTTVVPNPPLTKVHKSKNGRHGCVKFFIWTIVISILLIALTALL